MTEKTSDDPLGTVTTDNEFFKQMINLVPADFYFDQSTRDSLFESNDDSEESGEEEATTQSKGQKRKKKLKKQQLKRAKFDPDAGLSVTDLQTKLIAQEDGPKPGKKRKAIRHSGANGIEELREKLQKKIESMQANRKANKLSTVDKKKIRDIRAQSKTKHKSKMKDKKPTVDRPFKSSAVNGGVSPSKPSFNKDGQLVFSRFDFSNTESQKKKKLKGDTGKDYKKMLEKVIKHKENVEKLRETDSDKAHKVEEKAAWQKALLKAEGLKVRDDPEKLKKAIKRKEKKKMKSKKSWEQREEAVEKKKQERQEKRNRNLGKKKDGRKEKKMKKLKKKGRIIPGF